MSSNFFDSIKATKYTVLFEKFQKGLQLWSRTGREPEAGDQDIKYYLALQEKRLKEHHLEMRITMEDGEDIISAHQVSVNTPIFNKTGLSKYNKSNYFQSIHQTVEYFRDGEKIDKQKDYVTFYQTVIDPDTSDSSLGLSSYVCPNCGAISTVKELQDTGCTYCGTHFLMKDLYPKITNYYCLESPGISDKQMKGHKKFIIGGAAVLSLIYTVIMNLVTGDISALTNIFMFLGGALIFAFMLYFGMSIFYLVRLIGMGVKSMTVLSGSAGSKGKITGRLKKYDPAFDYEYFEGKALSLARIIMFHDDLKNCAQYRGTDTEETFSDIIDIKYRGGIGIDSVRRTEDKIKVSLRLYLNNTLDDGKKIRRKDETVRMEMYHDVNFPVDQAFSIVKVNCQSCGGSFDAGKQKCCPYCGNEYDAGRNDWIVTKIER